jgi:uncharacterized protein YaaW (UPF0174 family)
MVYVIIYPQNTMKTETKTFRSVKALLDYCFNEKKANYVEFQESYDASFDYFIHLKGTHK